MRRALAFGIAVAVALGLAACGGKSMSTTQPTSGGGGAGGGGTSANTPPVIDGITVQGSRAKEPANFADVGEDVAVAAVVRDAETTADHLQYQWTATAGSFSGSGASVTWTAPAAALTPLTVTVTLTVVESYGQEQQNKTTGSTTVQVHNSIKEVGDYARQFLLDFSDSSLAVDYVMRNFNRAKCPDPREVDSETDDVTNNRKNFVITSYRIGASATTINFGGRCPFRGKAGDGCAVVPSYWNSIDRRDNSHGAVDGNDIVAAAFNAADNRWWLCASDYDGKNVSGASRYGTFIK